jgi:hypothetical protein
LAKKRRPDGFGDTKISTVINVYRNEDIDVCGPVEKECVEETLHEHSADIYEDDVPGAQCNSPRCTYVFSGYNVSSPNNISPKWH